MACEKHNGLVDEAILTNTWETIVHLSHEDVLMRNVTYIFRGVGVPSSHLYTLHLTVMTLFNGFEGVNCASSWGFFGLFSVQKCVKKDIMKAVQVTTCIGLRCGVSVCCSPLFIKSFFSFSDLKSAYSILAVFMEKKCLLFFINCFW